VQDAESRLVTCMVTLQGFTPEEARRNPFSGTGAPMITADPFSGVGQRSVMTDLVAWIASESRGMTIAPPTSHPKERLAYQAGEKLFYYRAGPYDFGCVTCHGEEGKRIRLQNLPKMTNAKDAQRAFGTWPGYRVSEGEVRSMQWRMWECIRQMRFPELEFASDASIALITYLAKKAEGGTLDAPSIKR
jgi:sulfur-oxidizing protein SoxA